MCIKSSDELWQICLFIYLSSKRERGVKKVNKEKYEVPAMEVIEFDSEDVITTSGGGIELPDVDF